MYTESRSVWLIRIRWASRRTWRLPASRGFPFPARLWASEPEFRHSWKIAGYRNAFSTSHNSLLTKCRMEALCEDEGRSRLHPLDFLVLLYCTCKSVENYWYEEVFLFRQTYFVSPTGFSLMESLLTAILIVPSLFSRINLFHGWFYCMSGLLPPPLGSYNWE